MTPVAGALALAGGGLLGGAAWAQDAACREDAIDLRGPFGQARFAVEVADTPQEQARGLMFVEELPRGEGMLFAYPEPGPVSFWMRNTLIPLDMLFLSAEGVVTRIHENAVPRDETPIPGGDAVQYVLEINGGLAERLGIEPGAEARHPRIGEGAAWPCDEEAS